ncbi:MAG: HAD family hydrolase [Candidatus Nanohaloarchaea archaeon]|nr:HAD family hydrolase [Candidatus Nanohaloarchaea archaeon]
MGYDAIIFDNDGVLIDVNAGGEERRKQRIRSMYRRMGLDQVPDDYIEAARHRQMDRVQQICQQHNIDPDEFWQYREQDAYHFQKQQIQRGEKDLYPDFDAVKHLARRYGTGIVSNNQQQTIDFIIDHFQLHNLFQTAYGVHPSHEGVKKRKPNTYYLNLALADLGTRNVLYVGDSETDMKAAERAGLDAAFLRREHRANYRLETDPDLEVRTLQELFKHL